jgi:hypothetical protein
MEMPISVIITLFLAVTVGSMILLFGTDLLGKAKTPLDNQFNADDSRIIRQSSISDRQIASLIEQCYNESFGKAIKSEVCFAVTLDNDFEIKSSSVSPLVKIDQNRFKVNDGKTSSFSIIWDFINSKVEVKT